MKMMKKKNHTKKEASQREKSFIKFPYKSKKLQHTYSSPFIKFIQEQATLSFQLIFNSNNTLLLSSFKLQSK